MAELQSGLTGGFGLYPQTARGVAASGAEYYWYRGNLFAIDPQQQFRDLGQLVGGTLLPGGQVKTGVFSGGRIVMPPALDDQIWWLFYAFAGAQGTPDDNGDGTYTHYAPGKTAADDTLPRKYLTAHKITPTDGGNVGEKMLDQVVSRIQLGFVGGEFLTFQADLLGREPGKETPSGTGWTPGNYKGRESVPICALPSTAIQFPVGSTIEEAQAVTVDLVNIVPRLQDVTVIGSYLPHSWPVLGRAPIINLVQLYTTDDLYRQGLYNGDGSWNPQVFSTSFQASAQSAEFIKASQATEQGSLSYTTDSSDVTFTDDGQDFSGWETASGDAAYVIEVVNDDGTINWAYLGAKVDATQVKVYQDAALSSTGWNGVNDVTKTPSSYNVYPNRHYEITFKASKVDWAPAPPDLAGADLLRVSWTGLVRDAVSGLDWYISLTNQTSVYEWPTP